MSNKRISQLTDGTSFQAGDEAVVNRGGVNFKVDPTVGVVQQADIGTDPNQVPLNQYLGSMAYQDLDAVSITGGTVVVDGLAVDTDTLYVDATNNRVGIETSSPSAELEVNGDIIADGIYLGGTAAANLLDDYEEGTWTPAWAFSTSGSATIVAQAARYTKIGNIVTVMFRGYTSATSSPTGAATISGLPFTASSNTSTSGTIGEAYKFASDLPNIKCTVQSGSTAVDFVVNATNFATATSLQGSNLNGGATQNVLGFVITYEVA